MSSPPIKFLNLGNMALLLPAIASEHGEASVIKVPEKVREDLAPPILDPEYARRRYVPAPPPPKKKHYVACETGDWCRACGGIFGAANPADGCGCKTPQGRAT